MQTGVTEIFSAGDVLREPEDHSESRRCEADEPVHTLAQIAAHQRRDERAEIDAHVEDREARIAPVIVRPVQPAHDHADVPLQEPGADDDERQPEIEGRERRKRHAEVAARDQDATVQHRAPLPDTQPCCGMSQAVRPPRVLSSKAL